MSQAAPPAADPVAPRAPSTPYQQLGGEPVVSAIVERFYDLMDGDPAYTELRAMHAPDLSHMRKSLADFLTGWMGGPRHWWDERPGACMVSMHSPFTITAIEAGQWAEAMSRAIAAQPGLEPKLAQALTDALAGLAIGMARG